LTKILIVDDSQAEITLMKAVLGKAGYWAVSINDPLRLEQTVEIERPNLILMDVQLPDISGMEAARRLKGDEQTRTIPIIAVTAFAMSGDEAKILASGCDAYVSKPFNVLEFLKIVERWTTSRT